MWLLATALDTGDLGSHSPQSVLASSSTLCMHPLWLTAVPYNANACSHTELLHCGLLFLGFSLPCPKLPHLVSYYISFTTSNYVIHLFVHSTMVKVLSLYYHHSTHPLVRIQAPFEQGSYPLAHHCIPTT